jgi:RNA polymerase sigma-70 factor (ECF subfamily)
VSASDDASAEAKLCAQLRPRVHAWALRRTRDEAIADDVAQHAVLVVLDAVRERRVEDPSRLAAFALGVAEKTLSSWRRGDVRRAALLERFGATFERETRLSETTRDAARDLSRVERCLGELPPRAQSVLVLTFFAERSCEEIASELSESVANVRVLRHRALKKMHDCVSGGA